MSVKREGEVELPFDPALTANDARVHFIGRIRSAWTSRELCPKNMAAARSDAVAARVEIDEPFRDGLQGLGKVSHVAILTWLDQAPRNLIIQKPRHAEVPRGTFALRSPARPNPIGLHVVRLLSLDVTGGILHLEAIDVLDGTPVVDIKPYYASTDSVPEATIGDK